MIKLRYLSIPGLLLATSLTVAACGSSSGNHSATDPGTTSASSASSAASSAASGQATQSAASPAASAGSSSTPVSAPSGQAASSPSSASGQAAFAAALAAWKQAADAPLATENTYLLRAAADLREADNPSYGTAINQLTYLGHLPDSDETAAQEANGKADAEALNSFFGTHGLMM